MEKSPYLNIVDIQKASPHDLEDLEASLAKTGGKLNVLVHPFFTNTKGAALHTKYESPQEYQELRDRFIAETLANGHPLVVFEAYNSVDQLPQKISQSGTIYLVATRHQSPEPIGILRKKEDGNYHSRPDLDWQDIGTRLKNAGTKTASVGGLRLHFDSTNAQFSQYLSVYNPLGKNLPYKQFHTTVRQYADRIRKQTDQNTLLSVDEFLENKELIATGCVGGAWLGLLQQGIDVDFSPIRATEYATSVTQSAKKY